jgi:hypothetical protein
MLAKWMTLVLLGLGCSMAKETPAALSREEALTLGRTHDGRDIEKLWFEHGDKTGPYHHAGRVIIGKGGGATYQVGDPSGMRRPCGIGVNPGTIETRLDFFTSVDGEAWVTAHIFKPEVEVAERRRDDDPRSKTQQALGPAAKLAIDQGDLVFLKALLERGLELDGYLDNKSRPTALYQAVWERQPDLVKFLMEQGADPTIRDHFGDRPIDLAIEREMPEICEMLKRPEGQAAEVAGVPEDLLESIFHPCRKDELHFIEWNGGAPPEALLTWLRERGSEARPSSRLETLDTRPLGAATWYRDTVDGRFGRLIEAGAKREGDTWKVSVRNTSGPAMAGGGWAASYTLHHGYWHGKTTDAWDE